MCCLMVVCMLWAVGFVARDFASKTIIAIAFPL